MKKFLAIAMLLTGCADPNHVAPKPPTKEEHLAAKIYYLKDKVGLCYAAIDSLSSNSYVITSITEVDCEKVGL